MKFLSVLKLIFRLCVCVCVCVCVCWGGGGGVIKMGFDLITYNY